MMRSALYYGLRFSVGGHISLSACKVRHNSSLCSKLSVVGGGQMAEAILNSLHANKTQIMENVHVYDIKSERAQYLKSKYGVTVSEDLNQCIADAEILLLAVKPQSLEQLASELTTVPSGMVLSILAGCSIATLQQKFKTKLVMRTMPNTPAMISEGMTVWIASKDTPKSLKEKGQVMLRCIGEEVEVHDEKFVDMATAISGSGPAYVFLTMEAMIDAGVHMGFPRDMATKLVLATLRGSSSYALQSHSSVQTLKSNVTSPAGTTASALYELEKGGFRTVVADAVWAAYRKALELGGENSNVGPGRSRF